MRIEKLKTDKLIPYINNSRTHSENQVSQVAASITEFGFNNPILIDKKNTIIAGHGRLLAARKLGLPEVPCVRLEHLTETQKKAYIIADNKLALNAGWDEELLSLELKGLEEDGFDTSLLGFDEKEMAQILSEGSKDGLTDEDEIPEVNEEAQTKEGDLYQLGNHKLLCGDSTSVEQIERIMGGEKADMVFTDPPYRMVVTGGINQPVGKAAKKTGDRIKHLCEFDPKLFLEVLPSVFAPKNMSAYIFCNKDLVPDYLQYAVKNKYAFNILFWKKPNAIPLGGQYRPDVEYLLVFRKSAIFNNGVQGVSYSKLLEYKRENLKEHPTVKPVGLIENQLLIASNKNSIVMDFFGGSGSTLIACEKVSRSARLMELDPIYCDVIVKRWEDFTGSKAKLID
tara:strand:+ start:1081 stop:2271 length:1191 start_codon:yes stop_codon:yes gene_type:complete